jgi:hypothetical protein
MINSGGERIRIREGESFGQGRPIIVIRSKGAFVRDIARINLARLILALAWVSVKNRKGGGAKVFVASMADINKALQIKIYTDPRTKLPAHFHEHLQVFDRKAAKELLLLRGPGIDHRIKLIQDGNGRKPEVPWGPLYGMSRDKLLVLRKTLNELLDKGFIRVSNSPAIALILFVRKLGGGLRFCVDYRALNKLTRKD